MIVPDDSYIFGTPGTKACKQPTRELERGAVKDSPSVLFPQNNVIDTPLDHAHDEAMPLVEWARTPMGHSRPKEEYASVMASTIHLQSLCFVTGCPLVRLPKLTKSCSDLLKGWNAQSKSSKL